MSKELRDMDAKLDAIINKKITDLQSDLAAEREKTKRLEAELEQAREALNFVSLNTVCQCGDPVMGQCMRCIVAEALKGGEKS